MYNLYQVTVIIPAFDFRRTYVATAKTEGKAKTNAMHAYFEMPDHRPLRGEAVKYEITLIGEANCQN